MSTTATPDIAQIVRQVLAELAGDDPVLMILERQAALEQFVRQAPHLLRGRVLQVQAGGAAGQQLPRRGGLAVAHEEHQGGGRGSLFRSCHLEP